MKKILSILLVCACIVSMFAFGTPATASAAVEYGDLIWSDEFDGNSLNTNNWVYDVGYGMWGNNELEYYRSGTNNIVVSGGELAITAKKESYGGASYTSGRITTYRKQSFQYGIMEARMKMPKGQGLWPAFWMLSNSASWPNGGELDIMEHINSENVVYGTSHDWNNGNVKSESGTKYNVDVTQYHTYTIEWTEEYIIWYVDGIKYHEVDISLDSTFYPNIEVFHEPYYFLLNVAVGGSWPGDPVDSSFPATMYVDYVRVYDLPGESGGGSGDNGGDNGDDNGGGNEGGGDIGDVSSYPAWNYNSVYNTGDRVVHNGHIYEADYWTQGNEPSIDAQWDPWTYIGPVGSTPEPEPDPTVAATGITLYQDGAAVANGGSVSVTDADSAMNFTAAVTPADATNKDYTITVSNSAVASVSGTTATVTPSKATADTSVVITATSADGGYKASYTVNIDYTEPVVPDPEPALPDAFIFKVGYVDAYWATYDYQFTTLVACSFRDGVTYVPFRDIATAAGAKDIKFDADAATVTITNSYDMTFTLKMGETACTYTYAGQTFPGSLNYAPKYIDSVCCLPVRDVANITSANVQYETVNGEGYVFVSANALTADEITTLVDAYEAL